MPDGFFKVVLAVKAKSHGQAEIVAPDALADVKFSYLVVQDGGEEGIIKLSASSDAIRALERRKGLTRLTPGQREQLRGSYPAPRIKKKYRLRSIATKQEERNLPTKEAERDSEGKKIVETFQTVRSGFYLIDVPIIGDES